MKAIETKKSLPIDQQDSSILFEIDMPVPKGRDLLVQIEAVSINPVDYKHRQNSAKDKVETPKVIGWDTIGIVKAVGDDVSLFEVGDSIFYKKDIINPGANSEYHIVDERIVGHAPKHISTTKIAAMPLTAITAWEILFDRIRISLGRGEGKSILIIGGAGGVGSMAIQLAKLLSQLKVIATASRPETSQWCRELGADYVINHQDLENEMKKIGVEQVDYIVNFIDTNAYWDTMVNLIKPQGHIASITDSDDPITLNKLKNKSAHFSCELMCPQSMFQIGNRIEQHYILNKVTTLLEDRVLKSTVKKNLKGFTTENFRKAHRLLENNKTIGKIIITQ